MSSLLETTYPLPRKISEILLLTRILEISQGEQNNSSQARTNYPVQKPTTNTRMFHQQHLN